MSLKHRHFDPITVPAEAGRRRVHRIACSGCGASNDVSANTLCGSRAHVDLLKIWRRGGWTIGSNAGRDLCSDCTSALRRNRRAGKATDPEAGMNQSLIETPPAATAGAAVPHLQIVGDPPREASFDDKRIINAKIEEVYLDETRGYAPGWTDHRVAMDLNVPRKWVEVQRALNFGPLRDNEDIRRAVADATRLRQDAEALLADVREEAVRIRAYGEKLAGQVSPIANGIEDLTRRMAAIEKALR